jgi:hypothetical protein
MVGCSKRSEKKVKSPDESSKSVAKEDPKRLYTGPGTATIREITGARPIRYTIEWQSSALDYTQAGGAIGGKLDKVSGKLYQEGREASRFAADAAIADKTRSSLTLQGHVVVIGDKPAGTLNCSRLEWHTKEKLVKAFGRVTINGDQGTVGPVDELWCFPDLKRAGTPGSFQ